MTQKFGALKAVPDPEGFQTPRAGAYTKDRLRNTVYISGKQLLLYFLRVCGVCAGAGPGECFQQLLQPRQHRLHRVLQHRPRPYRPHEGAHGQNSLKG